MDFFAGGSRFEAKIQCRDDAIFERLSRRAQEIVKAVVAGDKSFWAGEGFDSNDDALFSR